MSETFDSAPSATDRELMNSLVDSYFPLIPASRAVSCPQSHHFTIISKSTTTMPTGDRPQMNLRAESDDAP